MSTVYSPGWAAGVEARSAMLAYLPPPNPAKTLEDEPATAVCDWWEPPNPMAIPVELCRRIREQATTEGEPIPTINGTYFPDLDTGSITPVIERVDAANRMWWNLEITGWEMIVKHYRAGEQHPEHSDMHPAGGATRKLVAGVQLSDPNDYTGGRFTIHFDRRELTLPSTVGTLTVFPGWTVHAVAPIQTGERWALIVNGFGPQLR